MMAASSLEALLITRNTLLSLRVTHGKSLLIILRMQPALRNSSLGLSLRRRRSFSSDDPDVAVRDVAEELLLRGRHSKRKILLNPLI